MLAQLLSGLVQGYDQGVKQEQDRFAKEELKKLQIKAFKQELERKDKEQQALSQLMQMVGSAMPTQIEALGGMGVDPQPKRMSLTDVLADPQGQMLALQSGKASLGDIRKFQQPNMLEVIQKLQQPGGAIGAPQGGMELTGIKLGPDGQLMPDFARPKFKTEVPSSDGMSMIRIDEFGREIGRRPMGPGEIKPKERSKGQTAVDTKFAEEYVGFKAAGGYADIEKQLQQLSEASKALATEKGLTGGLTGLTPEPILKRTNPRAIEIRDNVLDSAQRNLRLVLGAQFTEKEGERLLSRVYDMALKPEQNKKRVDRLIAQIRSAAKAKQEAIEYFEENQTLEGFKGKLWTLADFEPEPAKPQKEKPSLKGPGKNDDPLKIRGK